MHPGLRFGFYLPLDLLKDLRIVYHAQFEISAGRKNLFLPLTFHLPNLSRNAPARSHSMPVALITKRKSLNSPQARNSAAESCMALQSVGASFSAPITY